MQSYWQNKMPKNVESNTPFTQYRYAFIPLLTSYGKAFRLHTSSGSVSFDRLREGKRRDPALIDAVRNQM